jgi:hypothetical protein
VSGAGAGGAGALWSPVSASSINRRMRRSATRFNALITMK